MSFNRRTFVGTALAAAQTMSASAASLDAVLAAARKRHGIPALAAMVATPTKTLYRGGFGTRDSASTLPITTQSIFAIASMTKAITTTAILQLAERGKLKLDDPASNYLPRLANLKVFDRFDSDGKPVLRDPATPVLLRHLITHTSGFAYTTWNAKIDSYDKYLEKSGEPRDPQSFLPLAFDPGTSWSYGTGIDWAGRIVEAVSGQTLEEYFQAEVLHPLGMIDTSFILRPEKFDRMVSRYTRDESGALIETQRKQPNPPTSFNGGGGLYSTCEDYTRFMQMILNHGKGPGSIRVLSEASVAMMTKNQIGKLSAGKLKSQDQAKSSDMDLHPNNVDGFTYGFLTNLATASGRRTAGSLAWAGIYNTHFWIDPARRRCGVVMMQFLPFVDKEAVAMLLDFEHASYMHLRG